VFRHKDFIPTAPTVSSFNQKRIKMRQINY